MGNASGTPRRLFAPAFIDADEALCCPHCFDRRAGDEVRGVEENELADRRWPEIGDPGYPGPVAVECHYCREALV